jgi:isoquinoline 1-oxidoreductase beta subunit
MPVETAINRREMFKTGAALVIGFCLSEQGCDRRAVAPGSEVFKPNAWLRITPDNQITVLTEVPEMGQGTRTASAMILADELEADWSTIRVEQAPTIPEVYKNLGTGGSDGTRASWMPMRRAGAHARELFLIAAARKWQVPKNECRPENATIVHAPTGRRLRYGELVETASKLPPIKPDQVPLKDSKNFRFIGKPTGRVDTPGKVNGSAVFGLDVRVPGMLFAVIARCPYFSGELATCDDSAAKAVSGVRAVFHVPRLPQPGSDNRTVGGVAVVANSTWAAMEGRKALKVTWRKGPGSSESSENLRRKFKIQADAPPFFVAVNHGDAHQALAVADQKIEASYELPFQAHATMEPMNTTVHVQGDGIEVWSPTQIAAETQTSIVRLSGLPANKVIVHNILSGGSFGRRGQWDYPAEAWQVANKMRVPVQLLWTREDDILHDFYRPYFLHRIAGLLDDDGNIVAWSHRIVSTSVHAYFNWDGKAPDPAFIAGLELGCADMLPYAAQNVRLEYNAVDTPVPRAWWRSVCTATNAFATESFIDELAHSDGRDPYDFRMALLRGDRILHNPADPKYTQETRKFRTVLQLAADKSGWGHALPKGHGRGIACYGFGGSYVAQVAEVVIENDGTVRVLRVVSAIDCGMAVNPDAVRAQIEGGINYALTPVLTGEITIKDGAAQQSNFHDYHVLRINQAPDIEVHIVPSTEEPASGVGEGGVPPLAPAVANAVFAATGKRVRRLPIPKIA